jgi:sugar phosphate isomerase/epimerase
LNNRRPGVCFSAAAFADEPIEAIIPRLVQLGYDGVEIPAGHLKGKGREEVIALRHLASAHHLPVALLSPRFWLTRDLPERLEQSLATAAYSVIYARGLAGTDGLPRIRILLDCGPGSLGSAAAAPEDWQRATDALTRITALDPGVTFLIETHEQTLADTPDSTLRLLDRVAAPNLGISYKPGSGDPLPGWRALRHAVGHVHLQGPRVSGSGGYLEDGGHRLAELLAALRADDYAGTLSVGYRWAGVTWDRAASARDWLRAHEF